MCDSANRAEFQYPAKTPCPRNAPLINLAFELYASGQYSYQSLLVELHRRGLRNIRGGNLTLNGISKILQNPFYIGLIRIQRTGQTYKGVHEPVVSSGLWEKVQQLRGERNGPKVTRHNHLFQGIFRCGLCNKPMVPELQKGHVYYRCKQTECPTKTVREEILDRAVQQELKTLALGKRARTCVENDCLQNENEKRSSERSAVHLRIKDEECRLERLEDLLLDGVIESGTYTRKRESVQIRLARLHEDLEKLPDLEAIRADQEEMAELRKNLVKLYRAGNRREKRMIIENVWPNRTVSRRQPFFEPYSWVTREESDLALTSSDSERDRGRTLIALLHKLRNKHDRNYTCPD